MVQYRLVYFNWRARGEVARMLFNVAGVPFVDERVEFDQWKVVKPTTPFGQLPVLYVDDEEPICQSHVIESFLARRFGLAGTTDVEQARVDMIVACLEDIIEPPTRYMLESDDTRKAAIKQKYVTETLPKHLDDFTRFLLSNEEGRGFFVGNALTLADLAFAHFSGVPSRMLKDDKVIDWSKWPKLKFHIARTWSDPRLARWLNERPAERGM